MPGEPTDSGNLRVQERAEGVMGNHPHKRVDVTGPTAGQKLILTRSHGTGILDHTI